MSDGMDTTREASENAKAGQLRGTVTMQEAGREQSSFMQGWVNATVRQQVANRGPDGLRDSECGHLQPQPTDAEVAGCPEVIVRRCAECASELWWNVDQWRRL